MLALALAWGLPEAARGARRPDTPVTHGGSAARTLFARQQMGRARAAFAALGLRIE